MHEESSDTNATKIPLGSRIYDQLRVVEMINNVRLDYEVKHNITYDLVVKTRFDLYYHSAPQWNRAVELYGDSKIHTEHGSTAGYPHDCLCICTSHVMDTTYAARFSLLEDIYFSDDHGITQNFCAHHSIVAAMKLKNVEIGDFVCAANVRRSENKFVIP